MLFACSFVNAMEQEQPTNALLKPEELLSKDWKETISSYKILHPLYFGLGGIAIVGKVFIDNGLMHCLEVGYPEASLLPFTLLQKAVVVGTIGVYIGSDRLYYYLKDRRIKRELMREKMQKALNKRAAPRSEINTIVGRYEVQRIVNRKRSKSI